MKDNETKKKKNINHKTTKQRNTRKSTNTENKQKVVKCKLSSYMNEQTEDKVKQKRNKEGQKQPNQTTSETLTHTPMKITAHIRPF